MTSEPKATRGLVPGTSARGGHWMPRGGGEMGDRIRAFDWASTAVGPLGFWPMSLRVAVELCLNSRFPMFVWWGRELINIYNDAYAPMMGARHPDGLGRSARELWKEIWDDIGPQTDAVLLRGESTWNERRKLVLERNGFPEECYFTWSYSPILNETGTAAGLFCAVTEETGRVLAERQRDQFADRYAEQSRRFEKMLSSITDLTYVFDRGGRFVYASRRLLDIWGMTMEQASGKTFGDLNYPPELAAKLQGQIRRVIETRQPVVDETEFTDRRGYTGYYQYIYSPVLNADGEVEAVAGVTRELTERRRMEAEREELARAVERERANLAAIIEQAPAFIAVLRGPTHVFELVNERYYQIAGRRDLIGRTVREAFPDIAGQGFYELLDGVFTTGRTFTAEEIPIDLTQPDGSVQRHYMKLVYQALRNAEGNISGIFVHGVDLTEVVRSREALKQNEEFHRFATEAGRTGSWNLDLETMESVFSPMMCELVGLPAVQTLFSFDRWFQCVVPEYRDGMRQAITTAIDRGTTYQYDFKIERPDGTRRWLASRGGVGRDGSGKPVRLHGATVDITDKKLLEEEREALLRSERAARAEAEHANRAKDKFLAVLSHELRTPLSPVVMTIPAIESDPELPPRFKDDLEMIRRNIELEVKLIDDLLDLSRVTSGKLRLHPQAVRVNELLRHVLQSIQSDAATKRLHLLEKFDADNDTTCGDPARLQQVFWNLLRNAVKFTPTGGAVTVRTFNEPDPPRLVVEFHDDGVGIAPDFLSKIFDAFEQGDARTTNQFGGLGLGLAISKAVVEMHGGTITAHSDGIGRGSVFRVKLPAGPARMVQEPAPGPSPSPGGAPSGAGTSRLRRLLLVEDHPDTATMLGRLLKKFGFDVTTAPSVAGALQILNAAKFDVMISDIGLPDASGYDLMRQVQALHGIKGIALSGYGMEEDVRKSREAGFCEHLVKPVDIQHLRTVLERM